MFIIKHKNIFLSIAAALVILSIVSFFVFGFKIGIDFKGGAITEIVYVNERPAQAQVESAIATLGFGQVLTQPTGDKGYIIKTRDISDIEHASLLNAISFSGANPHQEVNFNSIGPSVGAELTRKAIIAIILVSLTIICFIAFAFRQVSKPVSSWKYGLVAVVTLLHDVILPVGLFSILSFYFGAEVDTLFVVAILTILGLSVSDTIVIFDRIRENIRKVGGVNKDAFSNIVGKSLEQSFVRSIATSFTVILVLLALFFFGPVATKHFALMLAAGMFFGTYSSIFIASPLLVTVAKHQK